MFENNNYSNENVNEQNNSQTVQSGSDAAHTEHNNGQTAGGAAGSTGNTGSYTGSGYTGGYSGSGYTGGYSGMNAGGYQNGGQGGYQNNAGYRSSAGAQGGYQDSPYQTGGYQNAGQNGAGQNGAGQGGMGQNGQPHGSYSGYGSYQSQQGNYQYGSTFSNNDYGAAPGGGRQGKKHKEKKPRKPMNPLMKKVIAVVVCGVFFGVCAGVSFLAVNSLGNDKQPKEITQATADGAENPQDTQESGAANDSGIKSTVTQGTSSAVVTDVTKVVEATMPSIVSITNQMIISGTDFWGQNMEQEQEAAGSGIIIGENDKELLVVTNYHVVADSTKLSVKFIDDEVVEAQIKGTSPSMDLAVIAVKLEDINSSTKGSIAIATMGDSDTLKVGEPVIAIGNALGYGQSVTTGVVSALNRTLEVSETGTSNALIQTDAAINPGNSGGALLDIKGQVIGINSNKIGGSTIEGMGYAIPISSAKPIIEELMNRETKEKVDESNRGFLGISCINVTKAMGEAYGMPEGIYVAQVYPATGADNAGLVKGDIITGFAGATVTTQDDLTNSMQYYAVGDTVELTIMRGNPTEGYQEQKVNVTLTSQEAMNTSGRN
ncbi:MAG: trypsin-like peptidase domain-containing protein [Clostridium sp.]|uniref:S1C family serine protease n=1 Tax=Eisenbergiella porci TaxID=2652274 RepID=UPI00291519DA|nr:trypsin-like peptidase domain-containing protein [Clostridium sp.]